VNEHDAANYSIMACHCFEKITRNSATLNLSGILDERIQREKWAAPLSRQTAKLEFGVAPEENLRRKLILKICLSIVTLISGEESTGPKKWSAKLRLPRAAPQMFT
jgi:hypothetical protein